MSSHNDHKWQISLIFSSNRSYFISTDRPLIHSCHSFVYAATNLRLVRPYAYNFCFTLWSDSQSCCHFSARQEQTYFQKFVDFAYITRLILSSLLVTFLLTDFCFTRLCLLVRALLPQAEQIAPVAVYETQSLSVLLILLHLQDDHLKQRVWAVLEKERKTDKQWLKFFVASFHVVSKISICRFFVLFNFILRKIQQILQKYTKL